MAFINFHLNSYVLLAVVSCFFFTQSCVRELQYIVNFQVLLVPFNDAASRGSKDREEPFSPMPSSGGSLSAEVFTEILLGQTKSLVCPRGGSIKIKKASVISADSSRDCAPLDATGYNDISLCRNKESCSVTAIVSKNAPQCRGQRILEITHVCDGGAGCKKVCTSSRPKMNAFFHSRKGQVERSTE